MKKNIKEMARERVNAELKSRSKAVTAVYINTTVIEM